MKKTVLLILLASALSVSFSEGAYADQKDGAMTEPPCRNKAYSDAKADNTDQSSAAGVDQSKLKGNVTFSQKSSVDAGLQTTGGAKKEAVSSKTDIPPGWVVVGENSNGEVRYGPPDTTVNTTNLQEPSAPGESKRHGQLDLKGKQLPPTRLDPFIQKEPTERSYGDEGAPLPPPWESILKNDNGR